MAGDQKISTSVVYVCVLSYNSKGTEFMTVGGEIDEALTSRLLN